MWMSYKLLIYFVQRMQLYRFSCVSSQRWFLYRIRLICSWSCCLQLWQCAFSCSEAEGLAERRCNCIHGVFLERPLSRSILQLFRFGTVFFLPGLAMLMTLVHVSFWINTIACSVNGRDLMLMQPHLLNKWLYWGSLMTQDLSQGRATDETVDQLISYVKGAITYGSF